VSITITPASFNFFISTNLIEQQFKAMGIFTDGSSEDLTALAIWNSSNPNVAFVSNIQGSQGLVTVSFNIIPGTTEITATFSGITSNSAVVIVNF
jgi:hypothetical protein